MSHTRFGSSDKLPYFLESEAEDTPYVGGILSGTEEDNKFASWTKIMIVSCDGGFFHGFNKEGVEVNG